MNCPNGCGNTLTETTRDQAFPRPDGSFFVIKELRVLECQECGEIVIPAGSSREIDRILEEEPNADEYIEVPTYQAKSA